MADVEGGAARRHIGGLLRTRERRHPGDENEDAPGSDAVSTS